jgi:hypothetical protein
MIEREETTTFGLDSDKVARLLEIGSEGERSEGDRDADELKAELLRDRLAQTLALYDTRTDEVSRKRTTMSQVIGDLGGEPLGSVLVDERADLSTLRRIRRRARRLSESATSKVGRHVAGTIYYAAISAALLVHDARITTLPYADLATSLRRLANEPWIPYSLTGLFRKAGTFIEAHHGS